MVYPETAEGFVISDQSKWTEFKKQEFKLKTWDESDVDVAIDACGVCGSDVHSITGGWGETPLPLCVGHEIIGRAIKVGKNVKDVKVGDRVGVGAQVGADYTCGNCKSDNEQYCPNMIDTYGAEYPDGVTTQGGYSSHIRANTRFVFPIPENIATNDAAPMMCAGLTVWSPLVRLGCGPGKKVGIVGIGGLGHFAILWAAALGAEVTVISHSPHKKEDALKMGAKHFVCSKDKDWNKDLSFTLDFILNAADMTHEFDLDAYLSCMKVGGVFHNVGLPDQPLPQIKAQQLMPGQYSIGASHIGSKKEILEMLKLASEKNVKPYIETLDISEKGCAEAVQRVKKNDIKYRFTLTNFDAAFGKRS